MRDASCDLPLVLGGSVRGGGGWGVGGGVFPILDDSGDYRLVRLGCLVTVIAG